MIRRENIIEIKKNVEVIVTGTQVGTTGEVIETRSFGNLIYKAPYFYVSYEEKIDKESDKSSKTVLKYTKDELRVTRKGEVVCSLEFGTDRSYRSMYMTAFGEFELEMVTDSFHSALSETGAKFFVKYRIGMNSQPLEKQELRVEIKYL